MERIKYKDLRNSSSDQTNFNIKVYDKLNEIVDWINEQEEGKDAKCLGGVPTSPKEEPKESQSLEEKIHHYLITRKLHYSPTSKDITEIARNHMLEVFDKDRE